jgi:chromosome condensin MukBEF complex kleisin-like MukF subunit
VLLQHPERKHKPVYILTVDIKKNQHFAQRLPTTLTTFTENEPTEAPSNNDHVVDMMTKQAPL